MIKTPSNPVTAAIAARRTARGKFNDQPVDLDAVKEIIASGLAAPSSKNAKPWRFHVLCESTDLEAIALASKSAPGIESYVATDAATGALRPWQSSVIESAELLQSAAVAILIENRCVFSSGRQALIDAEREVLEAALTGYTFEILGLGTAIENMLLAATALGIGAAFMGDPLIVEAFICDRFQIQGDLVGMVVLGHGASTTTPSETFGEHDDLVRWYRKGAA